MRPNLPGQVRVAWDVTDLGPRRSRRQPDDDQSGSTPEGRRTTSISRPSASIPTSGPPKENCPRAAPTFRGIVAGLAIGRTARLVR